MKCPWCRGIINENEPFCPHCDNQIVDFPRTDALPGDAEPDSADTTNQPVICSRCDREMMFAGEEELQRSSTLSNLFLGEFGDLLKGTLRLRTYVCLACGKAEFFVPEDVRLRLRHFGAGD